MYDGGANRPGGRVVPEAQYDTAGSAKRIAREGLRDADPESARSSARLFRAEIAELAASSDARLPSSASLRCARAASRSCIAISEEEFAEA